MKRIARKSDGRRIFSELFKRKAIDRVWNGEITIAKLSRELGIARSLLQRWKRLMPPKPGRGVAAALTAGTPAPMSAGKFINALHRLIDRQPAEILQIRAELEALRRALRAAGAPQPLPKRGAS
jgi:transposase-like protein